MGIWLDRSSCLPVINKNDRELIRLCLGRDAVLFNGRVYRESIHHAACGTRAIDHPVYDSDLFTGQEYIIKRWQTHSVTHTHTVTCERLRHTFTDGNKISVCLEWVGTRWDKCGFRILSLGVFSRYEARLNLGCPELCFLSALLIGRGTHITLLNVSNHVLSA